MQHNYSLENQITNGVVQYIEEIKTDFNTLQVLFRDANNDKKTSLEVVGFNNFSIVADSPENIVKDKEDYSIHSLIGFTYEENSSGFLFCMKTDEYEVMFESNNFPIIRKL